MISFDKLKLVSTLDCIVVLDPANFEMKTREGRTVSLTMSIQQPFKLNIEISYCAVFVFGMVRRDTANAYEVSNNSTLRD